MPMCRRAEPVERDGSWVSSRLRNRLQESVTVNTGRVIPAGTRSTGSVFWTPTALPRSETPRIIDAGHAVVPQLLPRLQSPPRKTLDCTQIPEARARSNTPRTGVFASFHRSHICIAEAFGPAWMQPQDVSRAINRG